MKGCVVNNLQKIDISTVASLADEAWIYEKCPAVSDQIVIVKGGRTSLVLFEEKKRKKCEQKRTTRPEEKARLQDDIIKGNKPNQFCLNQFW